MSDFKRKATVVATAWDILEGEDAWAPVIAKFNLGFPYAWLVYTDMGTLNEQGEEVVEDTYDFLLKAMGLEDSELFGTFMSLMNARDE